MVNLSSMSLLCRRVLEGDVYISNLFLGFYWEGREKERGVRSLSFSWCVLSVCVCVCVCVRVCVHVSVYVDVCLAV